MKILLLSFYFEPDLCAGSFRATALAEACKEYSNVQFEIVTTHPNRYGSYKAVAEDFETDANLTIHRISIPNHRSGILDQAWAFATYFTKAIKIAYNQEYDLVFSTSSRLFTAFLGAVLARTKRIPLYLDIRDIFYEVIQDISGKGFPTIILPLVRIIEIFTFRSANRINVVSRGFSDYIKNISGHSTLSYHTNGIDDIFTKNECSSPPSNATFKIITYAGNIGKGQGLETIVPQIAQYLGNSYRFRLIGDGGTREKLENEISRQGLRNIEIIDPVDRKKLVEYYKETDYLFLHLNSLPAFEKVLPSKIFEYGAIGKQIIAGVSGYAKDFLEEYLPNTIIFAPSDIDSFRSAFSRMSYSDCNTSFRENFSRRKIMKNMASDIVRLASNY